MGPKRDEVTGEWRRLHNEELYNLYCSPNILWVITSQRMKWAGYVAHLGKDRGVFGWGNLREREPLGRPRYRWEDNITKIFKKWEGWAWTGLI